MTQRVETLGVEVAHHPVGQPQIANMGVEVAHHPVGQPQIANMGIEVAFIPGSGPVAGGSPNNRMGIGLNRIGV